ncbi:MAG: sugar-binding transcriptional regulator [Anaerolineales bacterium]|nr:sugar-binding transcriptional regulator [Anaerolineales bacterium]
MTNYERLEFLATVADLYYLGRRSQAEIARKFGYSRSAISRLLTEAHQHGLVDIRINHPIKRSVNLETELCNRYGLRSAYVVQRSNLDYTRMLRLLGKAGAAYLDEITDLSILGLGWGTALFEVGNALHQRRLPLVKVVQMIGGIGHGDPHIDGPDLARTFAQALGAQYFTLNAPHFVADARTRASLMTERHVHETLDLATQANYAFVGVGSVEPERSALVRAGYFSAVEMDEIKRAGAVGDICGTHFDENGRILNIAINQQIVGISLRALSASNCTIVGIAGGKVKAAAILGALRGGFLDVLVTDSNAAEAVLAGSIS